MKVKDLVSKLEKLNPEMDLLCFSESEDLTPKGYFFRVMEIVDVTESNAEASRDESGVVSVKFEQTGISKKYAAIELTSDI
ncbi:MAG: hypothetical protein COA46_00460 [Porticoccaceae bacterium]|nr:MAG: hypothetical protein COA46_00460 [Porticoccaceae bacterium]